tara:strand:- start:35009 stop:41008 length:6000 start_codon:yes stop_codon:yes gene_type:complete
MKKSIPKIIQEQDQVLENKEIVDNFLEFCKEELGYTTPVEVNLVYSRNDLTTLASYNFRDFIVNVYAKDRAIADVLRSIAHELVHHKQNEDGKIDGKAPDIGGDIEDEANAVAGQLVKKFGYDNMNIYEQRYLKVSTVSGEKTDRELCDDPEDGEFFCLAGSENLGTTDIYKDDGYNLIHQFSQPYHLSDVTPDEKETYHEPGAKKVKKTVLKPKFTAPFNVPINEQEEYDGNGFTPQLITVLKYLFSLYEDSEGVNNFNDRTKNLFDFPPQYSSILYVTLLYNRDQNGFGSIGEMLNQLNYDEYEITPLFNYYVLHKEDWTSYFGEEECVDGYGEISGEDCECDEWEDIVIEDEAGNEIRIPCNEATKDELQSVDLEEDECECQDWGDEELEYYYYYRKTLEVLSYIQVDSNDIDKDGYVDDTTIDELDSMLGGFDSSVQTSNSSIVTSEEEVNDESDSELWEEFNDGLEGEIEEFTLENEETESEVIDAITYLSSVITKKELKKGLNEQDNQMRLFPYGDWEFPVGWNEDNVDEITHIQENVPEPIFKKIFEIWDKNGIDFSIFKLLGVLPDTATAIYVLKRYIQNTTKPIPVTTTFDCDDLTNLFDRNDRDYDMEYIEEYLCGKDEFWEAQDWYQYGWDDYMLDLVDENNWKTIGGIFGGVSQSVAEHMLAEQPQNEEEEELIEKYQDDIDEIQSFISWANNDAHEDKVKSAMAEDIEDKIAEHFEAEGQLYTDNDGSKRWTIEGDLRDYINDQWDNTDTYYYHSDYSSQPIEDWLVDMFITNDIPNVIFSSLMDEEYKFWDYCEGKRGDCLQTDDKFFSGYWTPDYDINEILADRLGELSYQPEPMQEEINDLKKDAVAKKMIEDDEGYTEFSPFTPLEIKIMNYVANQFTENELKLIAGSDSIKWGELEDKWVSIMKLFGEMDNSHTPDPYLLLGKSSRFAKWSVDNWNEATSNADDSDVDFSRVKNPVKKFPSVYTIRGDEDGWQHEYKSGEVEMVAYDMDDAYERGEENFWDYEPDMETMDYGDYDHNQFEIGDVNHERVLREINKKDKVILNKIVKEYSLPEITELTYKSEQEINEIFTSLTKSETPIKNYLTFITENIWPLKSNYDSFSGKIRTLSEQEDEDDEDYIDYSPFTSKEVSILNQLRKNLTKTELQDISRETPNSYGKAANKFWNIMKLFGITFANDAVEDTRTSIYAKWALDNWTEDGDYRTIEQPIKEPLKWYEVDRQETGSQIEYRDGTAEVLGYNEDDAGERADDDFYSWGGDMETTDYGDYESYDSSIERTDFIRMDEQGEMDLRTRALISIGGIQRDKVTTPKFIKNIFKSSGHKAKSSGIEPEDGEEWNPFYTPGTNIDLNSDVQRVRDRIRFEEYGEMFQQGIEGRGFAFEGMLAGLFNGEPMEAGGKEDIKVGNDYYSIKQSNPGDAWDTGSLMGGFKFAKENMVNDGFSEEEIPPTPVDLMVAGEDYIGYKAQMLTESFKATNGQPLQWIFAHVLNDKQIEYEVLDSEELISAILSSDCSKGTGSKACAVGRSRKSDTGVRIKSRFVLGNPKMITFPTVSEDEIKSIIYDPEGDRVEDKIRRIFKNPNKVSQYTVDYIRDNPEEFKAAVEEILPTLNKEERKIAYNIITEQYDMVTIQDRKIVELTPQIFKVLDEEFSLYPHPEGELTHMGETMSLYSHSMGFFVPLESIYDPVLNMLSARLAKEDINIFTGIITDWLNKEMSTTRPALNEDDGYVNDMVYREEPRSKHIRRMGKDLGSLKGFPIENFKTMPPPENESDVTQEEIEYLDTIPVDDKLVESADNIDRHFKQFLNSKGLEWPIDQINQILPGVRAIILKLKYYYNRPRPWQIANVRGLKLDSETLQSSSTPSYPSGHAAQGKFIGRLLADMYPEYAEELTQIGEEIAFSRNMAKIHYPSDSEFGKLLGDEMYDYVYETQPELEMELDEYCPMGKPNKCTVVNYKELPDTLQESYVQRIINTPLTCEERELGPRPY